MNVTSYFTFGTAKYRPILSDKALDLAVPVPQPVGEWRHVPYGNNVYVTDGSFQHVTWSPNILLLDSASYNALRALRGQVEILSLPRGGATITRTAVLMDMSGLQYHPGTLSYRGTVTFGWDE